MGFNEIMIEHASEGDSKLRIDARDYQDKSAIEAVIGAIMKNPLLLRTHRLTEQDFVEAFDQYVYVSINGLARIGNLSITPDMIEQKLQKETHLGYETFVKYNGMHRLENAINISQEENFETNYNIVRKWSILRQFVLAHIDVRDFYDPKMDENNLKKLQEQRERFDKATTEDIVNHIKSKINKISSNYNDNPSNESIKIGGEEAMEQKEAWKIRGNYGYAYASNFLTTANYGIRRKRFNIMSAPSGVGKCLPNYMLIPTPIGWRQVGNIKPGDYLFGQNGQPTKVLAIYPQSEQKQIWKITFKDGRTAECCGEHLWEYYYDSHRSSAQRVENTETIYNRAKGFKDGFKTPDGQYRYKIKLNKAVEYPEKQLAIDPYVFGLFLGDGSFREHPTNKSIQFSTKDEALAIIISSTLNLKIKKSSDKNYTYYFQKNNGSNYTVTEFLQACPELINTYSYEKFIPSEYLLGSVDQRMALLQGLLDTDGHISAKKGRISFSTTSKKLCDNVVELCRSLGMITAITEDCRPQKYTLGTAYRINILCSKERKPELFRLKRKQEIAQCYAETTTRKESRDYLAITNIEPLNQYTDMTCFTVEAPDSLFLCNNFIVTHNTRVTLANMCHAFTPFFWNEKTKKWQVNPQGQFNSALYICTEMELRSEIEPIIQAYIAAVPESHIVNGKYEPGEEERVNYVINNMRQYDENGVEKNCGIYCEYMPDFDIASLRRVIEKHVVAHGVGYVFFDYIHTTTKLNEEYNKLNGISHPREDQVLLNLSTALKEMSREFNISIDSCTQLNGDWEKVRDMRAIAGAKAIVNKCDTGTILTRVTALEKKQLDVLIHKTPELFSCTPTHCLSIHKNRGGRYNDIRIWLKIDYDIMRVHDLFVTDGEMNLIPIKKNSIYIRDDGSTVIIYNAKEQYAKGEIDKDTYEWILLEDPRDPSLYNKKSKEDRKRLKAAEDAVLGKSKITNENNFFYVPEDEEINVDEEDFEY